MRKYPKNQWLLVSTFVFLATSFAHAQNFRVTLLGTGSPAMFRSGPSIFVVAGSQRLLFDCGRGTAQQLFRLKVPLAEIRTLFFTHLHSDHVVGFPDLWLNGWTPAGGSRTERLRIWGPSGTREMASYLQKAYEFDIRVRGNDDERFSAEGIMVDALDITAGVVYDENGVLVTAFEVDHGPVKPAFGYRVDFAGRSVVLSGDTRFSENLIRASEGADLVIHEVVAPDAFPMPHSEATKKIIAHHTTPEQVGEVFSRVKPKLAVYSHISPGNVKVDDLIASTRKTYAGPLEVGADLMSFDVGEKIVIHRPPGP